jgi:predicted metal-binding protein
MRKIFVGCAAIAVLAVLVAPLLAATETVTGRIVDESCYLKDKANNVGLNHKMPADVTDCALACAKKGRPLALLTTDGKVYTLAGGLAAENNAKLVGHVNHVVSVTGDVATKDGKSVITADALKMVSK